MLMRCVVAMMVALACTAPATARDNLVLVEALTNAGARTLPEVEAKLTELADDANVLAIQMHAWWPDAGDARFLAAAADVHRFVRSRGVDVNPACFVDGRRVSLADLAASVRARRSARRTVDVDVAVADEGEMRVLVARFQTAEPLDGCRARFVLVTQPESARGGHVFRGELDVPDAGLDLREHAERVVRVPLDRMTDGLEVVAIVEDGRTGEVLQTAMTGLDLAAERLDRDVPALFALQYVSPHPMAGSSLIRCALPQDADVRVSVYDVRGREVAAPVHDRLAAGHHAIQWDGTSKTGEALAPGVYFVRMTSGDFQASKKLVLVDR